MEHYWEIERLRALQEDTPQFWEQQSGFLRPVVQPNDYHWMSEPSNTTFAQQDVMWRCDICNGNHPSNYCEYNYNPGWQNYQNHSWYEEPSHFTEPHFSSYPPSTFDLYQEPEPSEEDQLIHMFKEKAARFDAQVQSNAESIQRMTDQIRQLIENQNNIPQKLFSDDTNEAFEYQSFHNDTSTEKEAEQYQQPEVSVQEPEPVRSRFDLYYSDSDEDKEAELLVPTASKVEDGILYPQNEDLGDCFAMTFEEDLPEPSIPLKPEDEDLMSDSSFHPQVEQETEQMEEQISELIEDSEHSGETSLCWGVQFREITQKLDRMELPFQVKHHTRPPDFLSFFSGTTGATNIKKVAQALNETKYFLSLYCWKRPFKSNAHGIVFNRTSKTTLKPP